MRTTKSNKGVRCMCECVCVEGHSTANKKATVANGATEKHRHTHNTTGATNPATIRPGTTGHKRITGRTWHLAPGTWRRRRERGGEGSSTQPILIRQWQWLGRGLGVVGANRNW
jgi:hypothetical protein